MRTEANDATRPRITAPSSYIEITDDTKFGWEPNNECGVDLTEDGEVVPTKGHEECIPLTLAHLDSAYKDAELGGLRICSYLQLVMCLYAIREGFGNRTESFLRQLLEGLGAVHAIHVFTEFRKYRSFLTLPTVDDLFKAIERRYKFCKRARGSLTGESTNVFDSADATKYRPIKYTVKVHEFAGEDKHEWHRLLQNVPTQMGMENCCVLSRKNSRRQPGSPHR
ncbi:hypothetical protein AAVH_17695 [Aphelenchoides avenae]|nr:hypothetical protein AAVH_17695 [Aphelenchus avenae]